MHVHGAEREGSRAGFVLETSVLSVRSGRRDQLERNAKKPEGSFMERTG